jgi:hypothetical protein
MPYVLVQRLIVRLDFDTNYDVFDRPGEILRTLSRAPISWEAIKDQVSKRVLGVEQKFEGVDGAQSYSGATSVVVDPTSLAVGLEDTRGFELPALCGGHLPAVLELMDALCALLKIQNLRRAGVRAFHASQIDGVADVASAFSKTFTPPLLVAVRQTLGAPTDYGLAFDGESSHKVKYHYRCGPFAPRNADECYPTIKDELKVGGLFNFFADVDCYEEQFALAKRPVKKWIQPSAQAYYELHAKVVALVRSHAQEIAP